MFNTEELKAILQALERIQEGEYSDLSGICYALNELTCGTPIDVHAYRIVAHYAESWVHYSGDKDYPVPHIGMTPEEAYNTNIGHMWDKARPYGSLRWDLLEHIINCIKKDLQDAQ